jgi:signal transduction histidine kinase
MTVVALAFQPVRLSVVHLANRLAYGSRAQPYEALAELSRRLAGAPPPEALLPAVAEAAARAVSAGGAVATLDIPGGASLIGTWGTVAEHWDHTVEVRSAGRRLGRLDVACRKGRTLSLDDVRLLEALAEQTAVAFRNTVLASELADRVADLDRTNRRLAESRLRLVEADDAARQTLEAAISRQVLPRLANTGTRVREARAVIARGGEAGPGLDRLVEDTNLALEALRELTRGVFPTQLARAGLVPAVRSLLARAGHEAALSVDGAAGRRFSARVEAALYFCCAEAVTAGISSVGLGATDEDVVLVIEGIDVRSMDLRSVTDRVEAVGGTLRSTGGRLQVSVPIGMDQPDSARVAAGDLGPDR